MQRRPHYLMTHLPMNSVQCGEVCLMVPAMNRSELRSSQVKPTNQNGVYHPYSYNEGVYQTIFKWSICLALNRKGF